VTRPPKVKPKVKAHVIIARAVEEGVRYGYKRAHRHSDAPSEEALCAQIEAAVVNALDEVLDFSDED
jgi:hypothetical protein